MIKNGEETDKNEASPQHVHLLHTLPGKIAEIYDNDELDKDLKHDIVCRLIATSIGGNSASLLLYKGSEDKLYGAGRYIDPNPAFANARLIRYSPKNSTLTVMKYMSVLEFLEVHKPDPQKKKNLAKEVGQLYHEYRVFRYINPICISKEEFVNFITGYYSTHFRTINHAYRKYKDHIRKDRYCINNAESITGMFYSSLTHKEKNADWLNGLSVNDKCLQRNGFLALNLNEVESKRKTCSNNLRKEFGVDISTDAYYVGIPLQVNNRPIGVLRMLIKKDLVFNIPQNRRSYLYHESLHDVDVTIPEIKEENYSFVNAEDVLKYVTEVASLESISVILSQLLSSKFYSDGMRQIALNANLSKDFKMEVVANKLADIVNCYGCVIRLANSSGKDACIRGYSSNVEEYVNAVHASHDPYITADGEFQPPLAKLFYPLQPGSISVPGIKGENDEPDILRRDIECIKIDFHEHGLKEISYLKLEGESLVSRTDWTDIGLGKVHRELKKIFKSGDGLFREFDLHSIILIPIKDWNYGFVTFANTSNRPFLTRDVELLIPVVKRVGIELKYNSSLAKAEAKSKEELQDGQRLISHQVMAPLVSMRNHIQNLADGTIAEEDLHLRRSEIINAYTYSIDFAKSNEWLLTYMKDKEIKPQLADVRIILLLIQKARIYQTRARDTKGLRVPVIFEEGKTKPEIKSDKELLSHVLLALIDNAIKYSYNHIPPPFGIVTTDPCYPPPNSTVPSYVPITLTNDKALCTITIENWGCPIEPDEVKNLTQYMQRGNNAKRFEANGSGIGLFLANQIVESLGGTLQVIPNGDHTKIIITFKQ